MVSFFKKNENFLLFRSFIFLKYTVYWPAFDKLGSHDNCGKVVFIKQCLHLKTINPSFRFPHSFFVYCCLFTALFQNLTKEYELAKKLAYCEMMCVAG